MSKILKLIPVLQMQDIKALEDAKAHLSEKGHFVKIYPFEEIGKDEITEWMNREKGGYVLYIEKEKYDKIMKLLEKFFGYEDE